MKNQHQTFNRYVFLVLLLFSFSMEAMNEKEYKKYVKVQKLVFNYPTESLYRYMQNVEIPLLKNVQEYVATGANPNDSFQGTPLLEQLIQKSSACSRDAVDLRGYLTILEYYLSHGAEPTMYNSALRCPLQWVDAITNTDEVVNRNIIRLLYKYGANAALQNEVGETAFFDDNHMPPLPLRTRVVKLKRANIEEKMYCYLWCGCYSDRTECIKSVQKMDKVMLTTPMCAFLWALKNKSKENSCYDLPRELKKYIIFSIEDAIEYQKTIEKKLFTRSDDQLPELIRKYPQWTRQSIKKIRLIAPQRAQSITNILSAHYKEEIKKVLAIRNNRGAMAHEICPESLSSLLNPNVEGNFTNVIFGIINQR